VLEFPNKVFGIMVLPFSKVITYAHAKPFEIEHALKEFFGKDRPAKDEEELVYPLFNEWLINDFRQINGGSFLAEYCVVNPDNLDEVTRKRLEQVVETAYYSMFELQGAKPGYSVTVEDLESGKKMTVWDAKGSFGPDKGLIYARAAKVEGKWIFTGANPMYLPITHTERAKKFIKETLKNKKFSPKDTWELIKDQRKQKPLPPKLSKDGIEKLRKDLRKKYEKTKRKYQVKLSFDGVLKLIYEEDRQIAMGDFWQMLIKKGIPEKFFFQNTQLFQDIWNYFPHKILNDKSPIEMFNELKG